MYKVLLADDEQIERMALARRLLNRFGDSLRILQAVDGKEAVKLCFKVWKRQSRSADWMRTVRSFS